MVPPVYVMVSAPERPSDQPMAPDCFMDMVSPISVVPSTFADWAPPVFCCTCFSAATGLALETAPALSEPDPPELSEPLQAAIDVSAAAAARAVPMRRAVLVLMYPSTPRIVLRPPHNSVIGH